MGPLGWLGRLPAWVAGVLVGLVVGLPLAAWILWPVVAHRTEPVSDFSLPEPTYAIVTPSPSPVAATPSSSASPRLTAIERANVEWARQEADHQAREAAEATRSVAPDRCCTRPPVAPQATAQPRETVKYGPAPAPTATHNKLTPTPTPSPSPSPEPSDPTYTETPVYVDAYCGRSKIGLTAISVGPEGAAGTPVACTEVEGELMPKWLPLPPTGLEAK